MSKNGPKTPRVWSDRWVRVQENWWRPPHACDDGHDCPKAGPEPAQRMWRRINRHNSERALRGYSRYDWWSFDTFVCALIANACRDFRLYGHGYPADMSVEEWNTYLLEIEEPLRVWAEQKFDFDTPEQELEAYRAAQKAMAMFAHRLGSMWD